DVKDTGSAYEVAVDLPGCKKEDVKMELDNGYLTIQAVRSHSQDQTGKNGRYVRRESFSGTCARSFYVGEDVKKEDVRAKFEDGVLKITLPHAEQKKELPAADANRIEIEGRRLRAVKRHRVPAGGGTDIGGLVWSWSWQSEAVYSGK